MVIIKATNFAEMSSKCSQLLKKTIIKKIIAIKNLTQNSQKLTVQIDIFY